MSAFSEHKPSIFLVTPPWRARGTGGRGDGGGGWGWALIEWGQLSSASIAGEPQSFSTSSKTSPRQHRRSRLPSVSTDAFAAFSCPLSDQFGFRCRQAYTMVIPDKDVPHNCMCRVCRSPSFDEHGNRTRDPGDPDQFRQWLNFEFCDVCELGITTCLRVDMLAGNIYERFKGKNYDLIVHFEENPEEHEMFLQRQAHFNQTRLFMRKPDSSFGGIRGVQAQLRTGCQLREIEDPHEWCPLAKYPFGDPLTNDKGHTLATRNGVEGVAMFFRPPGWVWRYPETVTGGDQVARGENVVARTHQHHSHRDPSGPMGIGPVVFAVVGLHRTHTHTHTGHHAWINEPRFRAIPGRNRPKLRRGTKAVQPSG